MNKVKNRNAKHSANQEEGSSTHQTNAQEGDQLNEEGTQSRINLESLKPMKGQREEQQQRIDLVAERGCLSDGQIQGRNTKVKLLRRTSPILRHSDEVAEQNQEKYTGIQVGTQTIEFSESSDSEIEPLDDHILAEETEEEEWRDPTELISEPHRKSVDEGVNVDAIEEVHSLFNEAEEERSRSPFDVQNSDDETREHLDKERGIDSDTIAMATEELLVVAPTLDNQRL